MREFLPRGAINESQFLVFLTSWVGKASPLCMYIMTHTCNWSNAHFKAGCWYIDCGKIFCLVEEEDARKACVEADSKGAPSGPNQGVEQDVEVEVDINQLPLKEKNKILAQRARNKNKVEDKAEKDAEKAKEKEKKDSKKAEKSGKSKPSTPILLFTETSYASPSQNPRKRDASTTQLFIKTAAACITDPRGLCRGVQTS
jgi:hypothetical protein